MREGRGLLSLEATVFGMTGAQSIAQDLEILECRVKAPVRLLKRRPEEVLLLLIGGVLGVSVLATVFSGSGGYLSAQNYVDGLVPAISVGSAVLFAGALIALLIPGKRREGVEAYAEPVSA